MPAGRPSELTEEVIEKAREYLHGYDVIYDDAVPSVAGLSIVLGRARSTMYDWSSANEQFAYILEQINATQEKVALSKGLRGDYNANLVKLLLGKHGYHDKADHTLSGTNGGPIETKSTFQFVGVDADSDTSSE